MTDFGRDEDVRSWLQKQGPEATVVFAARAALRAIPALALDPFLPSPKMGSQQRAIFLSIFRAVAVPWVMAAYPSHGNDLRGFAAQAAFGAGDATAPFTAGETLLGSTSTVAVAAASAARVASDAYATPGTVLRPSIASPAANAASAFITAVTAAGGSTFAISALSTDARMLDEGFSSATLANQPLWPGRMPDMARQRWTRLKHYLVVTKEDWEVWTDWYEDRLAGRAANPVVEVARAKIEGDWWKRPRVVNAHIAQIIEEPEIGKQTTGPEFERDTPDVPPPPIAASDLNSGDNLRGRLQALRLQDVEVIGARVALRGVPMLTLGANTVEELEFAQTTLLMFRVIAVAWATTKYSSHAANRARSASAFAAVASFIGDGNTDTDTGLSVASAAARATAASAANSMSSGVADAVVTATGALRAAAGRSGGVAATRVFDLALLQDLADLNGGSAEEIAGLPLWSSAAPPGWIGRTWDHTRNDLFGANVDWQVWVNWYEDRLAGNVRSEARELAYVEVPDELWAQGPAVVNPWISRRIEEQEILPHAVAQPGTPTEPLPPPPELIAVPSLQPAAIEPGWSGGRLTLPKAPAKSDLSSRKKFTSALKSLRVEMRAFAGDIVGETNIDKRFVSHVNQLTDQIPQKSPQQTELFRLGHAQAVFAGYAETVNEQWPPILASRYHGLVLHFDRVMRQSPLWREFARNAAQQSLNFQQVTAAPVLAAAAATVLREAEGAEGVQLPIGSRAPQQFRGYYIFCRPQNRICLRHGAIYRRRA